uniref:Uncharacterized protein n=1 Tax=Rhizophora mucronata TaxID=61149 RepID=A0A2P2N751_RHIMU
MSSYKFFTLLFVNCFPLCCRKQQALEDGESKVSS